MKLRDRWSAAVADGAARNVALYTLVCGLLAHGLALFNKQAFYDEVQHATAVIPENAISMGRWLRAAMTSLVARIWGGYNFDLPVVHGAASILLIAVAAWLIVRLFDIREKLYQALLCGLMVSFPVVTGTFGYMFTAPYYFVALVLACLAVVFAVGKPSVPRFLAASACVCSSMGIYQSYLSVTVSLIVILLFFEIAEGRLTAFGDIVKQTLYRAGTCVLGFGVYYGIWKALMVAYAIPPRQYQGMSKIGSGGIMDYLKAVLTAYKRFFMIFEDPEENVFPMVLGKLQWVVIALCVLGGLYLVVRQLRKNRLAGLAMAVFMLALPVCMNLVYLMGASTTSSAFDPHTLMLYGQCMPYVFLIGLLRHVRRDGSGLIKLGKCAAVAALAAMLLGNTYLDNACYLKAEMMLKQTVSDLTVMVTKIKSLDGYTDQLPVCFVMSGKRDATFPSNSAFADIKIKPYSLYYIYPYHIPYRLPPYLEYWCGFAPQQVDQSVFKDREEVQQMPNYPDEGSIRIIDDTVVVKW